MTLPLVPESSTRRGKPGAQAVLASMVPRELFLNFNIATTVSSTSIDLCISLAVRPVASSRLSGDNFSTSVSKQLIYAWLRDRADFRETCSS